MIDGSEQVTIEAELADLREQVRRLSGALEQAHQRYEELASSTKLLTDPIPVPREGSRIQEFDALLRTKTFRWFRPLRVAYGRLRFHTSGRVPKTPDA